MECHKVFLPHSCMVQESGLLIGWHDHLSHMTCVVGIIRSTEHIQQIQKTLSRSNNQLLPEYSIIGLLHDKRSQDIKISRLRSALSDEESCIVLTKTGHELPHCTLTNVKETRKDFILTIFDPLELLASVQLTSDVHHNHTDNADWSSLDSLMRGLVCFNHHLHKELDSYDDFDVTFFVKETQISGSISSILQNGFHKVAKKIDSFGQYALKKRFSQLQTVSNMLQPAVALQIAYRFKQFRSLTQDNSLLESNQKMKLRSLDTMFRILLDMVLGISLFLLLTNTHAIPELSENAMLLADKIVKQLQELLNWMMGFPAGLKLNSQLDHMLGRFFLYHIYLWTGYLNLLRPFLSDLLWGISMLGSLGISFQVALLQDLISMMTLHIYCFYVYAARLYRVQVYTLASLWRLFRGKKWNVLRKRVDSASFDVDQLFIGTLLFTILLFLLPTTALYYIVFTLLRLFTLALQGCLHTSVEVIKRCPVFILLLRLFNSNRLADNMFFTVLSDEHNSSVYLSLKLTNPSYTTLLGEYCEKSENLGQSWGELGRKLIMGHLIYPWMESDKTKTD